jgi:hypothetical protein
LNSTERLSDGLRKQSSRQDGAKVAGGQQAFDYRLKDAEMLHCRIEKRHQPVIISPVGPGFCAVHNGSRRSN